MVEETFVMAEGQLGYWAKDQSMSYIEVRQATLCTQIIDILWGARRLGPTSDTPTAIDGLRKRISQEESNAIAVSLLQAVLPGVEFGVAPSILATHTGKIGIEPIRLIWRSSCGRIGRRIYNVLRNAEWQLRPLGPKVSRLKHHGLG